MKGVQNSFAVWDYLVFFVSVILSMCVGIYFAFTDRKNKTEGEYLLASRSLSVIPVSLSISVSYLSAISILGNPAEMYNQGIAYMLSAIGIFIACFIAAFVFVPLIYPLKVTSAFEYLELRFNSKAVRLMGTFLQIISQVIYMSNASFAPATAFKVVTGFPVWATLVIMAVVSTFYTSIGGIKAVIWTDVFQCVIMVAGVVLIIVQATIQVGSWDEVWEINEKWQRLDIWNFDPNPTVRHSFWPLTIGVAINWMGTFGLSQAAVQRYVSLPTLKKAKMATFIVMLSSNFITLSCCVAGVAVFAYYANKNCDPVGKGLVDNSNQIIPFFVMETLAYPCVPGIFISALFAGALSSISSSLSALTTITWEDMLKPLFGRKLGESRSLIFLKCLVVVYGCIALGVGFIIKNLEGTVIQIALSLAGAVNGPMFGMFLLGAIFPMANAKGALGGAIISLAFAFWIAVGAFVNGVPRDKFRFPNGTCAEYLDDEVFGGANTSPLLSTTVASLTTTNRTMSSSDSGDETSGIDKLYTLSYLWYAATGMAVTIVSGLLISLLTGPTKLKDVPTKYQILWGSNMFCLPKSWQRCLNCKRERDDPEVDTSEMELKNGTHTNGHSNEAYPDDVMKE